jgi:hypothetical protein
MRQSQNPSDRMRELHFFDLRQASRFAHGKLKNIETVSCQPHSLVSFKTLNWESKMITVRLLE